MLYRRAIRGHCNRYMYVSGYPIVAFLFKLTERSHVVAISLKESVQHPRWQLLIAGLGVVLANIFKAIFKDNPQKDMGVLGSYKQSRQTLKKKGSDSRLPLLHVYTCN